MPEPMTETRFWERVDKGSDDECWEWQGKKDAYGYGQVRWGARYGRVLLKAHRVVWELHHGPIPEGLCVLHTCDNPACVNIQHLWLGTHADNQRDMSQKGRNHNTRKTHCPYGHEYTPENTYWNPYGNNRNCRECIRRRSRLYSYGYYDILRELDKQEN